jgi:hypothetical protein
MGPPSIGGPRTAEAKIQPASSDVTRPPGRIDPRGRWFARLVPGDDDQCRHRSGRARLRARAPRDRHRAANSRLGCWWRWRSGRPHWRPTASVEPSSPRSATSGMCVPANVTRWAHAGRSRRQTRSARRERAWSGARHCQEIDARGATVRPSMPLDCHCDDGDRPSESQARRTRHRGYRH